VIIRLFCWSMGVLCCLSSGISMAGAGSEFLTRVLTAAATALITKAPAITIRSDRKKTLEKGRIFELLGGRIHNRQQLSAEYRIVGVRYGNSLAGYISTHTTNKNTRHAVIPFAARVRSLRRIKRRNPSEEYTLSDWPGLRELGEVLKLNGDYSLR
jgi:hypothetical protein